MSGMLPQAEIPTSLPKYFRKPVFSILQEKVKNSKLVA